MQCTHQLVGDPNALRMVHAGSPSDQMLHFIVMFE